MRVATSESWRDKNSGERHEKTEWHTVVVFNENLAKIVEQYCAKGSKVYIEGKLQTRKWHDQSGNDRYSTEVVLQGFDGKIVLLGERGSGGRDDEGRGSRSDRGGSGASRRPAPQQHYDDMDDSIPF